MENTTFKTAIKEKFLMRPNLRKVWDVYAGLVDKGHVLSMNSSGHTISWFSIRCTDKIQAEKIHAYLSKARDWLNRYEGSDLFKESAKRYDAHCDKLGWAKCYKTLPEEYKLDFAPFSIAYARAKKNLPYDPEVNQSIHEQ